MTTEGGMGGTPFLDVIIPYFGELAPLEEAVASVRGQTRPDWRLVVVEDGDQRHGVAEWLAGMSDPRVVHRLNPTNLGVAANFQRCLEEAEAEFVTFLGCDDRMTSSYVATVAAAWERCPDASVVVPRVRVIDDDGLPQRTTTDTVKSLLRPRSQSVLWGQKALTSLMHGNWTYFPSICWRSEALRSVGFRADLPVTVDLAALAGLVLGSARMALVEEVLVEYRRHAGSASSTAALDHTRFEEERRLLAELGRRARQRGWHAAAVAAHLRLSSRAHALSLVPTAVRSRSPVQPLLRHAFWGWRARA